MFLLRAIALETDCRLGHPKYMDRFAAQQGVWYVIIGDFNAKTKTSLMLTPRPEVDDTISRVPPATRGRNAVRRSRNSGGQRVLTM